MNRLSAFILFALFAASSDAAEWSFGNVIQTPGDKKDVLKIDRRGGGNGGANINRFGFYSDLVYDKSTGTWLALSDRGPGGGVIIMQRACKEFWCRPIQ